MGGMTVFLPRHYHMTRVLLLPSHHYCLDICGPCNSLHYLGHVKNVYDDDDWFWNKMDS